MSKPVIYLVGGPTASGKSALALQLAQEHDGVVINTDAMQIYSGLPVLTAQPDATARHATPHKLYEILPPSQRSSAGIWLSMAQKAIDEATLSGKTPILVGGTGLYFKAITEGLADIPPVPGAVRQKVIALWQELGEEHFRKELQKIDRDNAAKLTANDKQRLVRAYEVAWHTGKPLGYWQKQKTLSSLNGFDVRRVLILPPRDELYANCDKRFTKMMNIGALDEAQQLLAQNLEADLPAMKILGVRELAAYLRDEITREDAITQAQQTTRNYAKRQVTWFKNQWKETEGQPLDILTTCQPSHPIP